MGVGRTCALVKRKDGFWRTRRNSIGLTSIEFQGCLQEQYPLYLSPGVWIPFISWRTVSCFISSIDTLRCLQLSFSRPSMPARACVLWSESIIPFCPLIFGSIVLSVNIKRPSHSFYSLSASLVGWLVHFLWFFRLIRLFLSQERGKQSTHAHSGVRFQGFEGSTSFVSLPSVADDQAEMHPRGMLW